MADSDRHDDDNEGRQNTRLLQQIVLQLQQINATLNKPNPQLSAIIANQLTIIGQNNQIISLLTPAPSTDVASLAVSVDKPTKQ